MHTESHHASPLSSPRRQTATPLQDFNLILAATGDRERPDLETFVHDEFFRQHGARISSFMPWLLGVTLERKIAGVAGLRPAAGTNLFIEQYLDTPVEQLLAVTTGIPVKRHEIIEIGNLAGQNPGITRFLFPILTELTWQNDYHWVVCNTTHKVQNALHRLGIPTLPLCHANPDRLSTARQAWGNYYATESTVIAIAPQCAHDALTKYHPDLLAACHKVLKKPTNTLSQ